MYIRLVTKQKTVPGCCAQVLSLVVLMTFIVLLMDSISHGMGQERIDNGQLEHDVRAASRRSFAYRCLHRVCRHFLSQENTNNTVVRLASS